MVSNRQGAISFTSISLFNWFSSYFTASQLDTELYCSPKPKPKQNPHPLGKVNCNYVLRKAGAWHFSLNAALILSLWHCQADAITFTRNSSFH